MDGASHISDGDPNVLNANRNDDGRWVNANIDRPDSHWNDNGAFAFVVPPPLFISRHILKFENVPGFAFSIAHSNHPTFCRFHRLSPK